jgi:hypothetical protein
MFKILNQIRTQENTDNALCANHIATLGIHLSAFPFSAGIKRTEASKNEPQLNMMRENTDGLCNFARCNMPLWMVLINVNPTRPPVNLFFDEFPSTDHSSFAS